ncbi:MAG TPA: hypothetical protein VHD36_24175 [Pirellulales bacterium]|nr:hypothetical protein [Pirellulales bacterium]
MIGHKTPAPKHTRRWFQFSLGTVFLAAIAWLGWEIHFSSYDWRGVPNRLESRVASGARTIDFAAETSFTWDRMFVFDCYSSQADVENALGFKWSGFRHTTIDSSDSVCLVVFVKGGKVVYWYEQPRTIDLSHIASKLGYSRSDAKFDVERTDWVRLKPVSASQHQWEVE